MENLKSYLWSEDHQNLENAKEKIKSLRKSGIYGKVELCDFFKFYDVNNMMRVYARIRIYDKGVKA